MESYQGNLSITAEVHENDESAARHILAEQLEKIAAGLRDGFRTEGRIMHPNGHAIGSFKLEQDNLPDE